VRRLFRLGIGAPRPLEAAEWEIEHYLAEQAERLVEEGLSPEAARAEAERRFGRIRRSRRALARVDLGKAAMDAVNARLRAAWATLAAAVRSARRQGSFSAAVILILALGIGANAAMFRIVDRLLLAAPRHVVDPGTVARVVIEDGDARSPGMSLRDMHDLAEHRGLAGFAAYAPRDLTVGSGADATRIRAVVASASLLPLLGVHPALGRLSGPEDDREGADGTVVLSHEYWRRALGADRGVLGGTLEIGGEPFQVVGVLPPGFTGVDLAPVDAWLPLTAAESRLRPEASWRFFRDQRGARGLRIVVRLAPGVGAQAAGAEATGIVRSAYAASERYVPERVVFDPVLADRGPRPSADSKIARWLAGVTVLVLLIACANVANLFLAHTARRHREVALRLALGISRGRLLAEFVTTSVLLALAGGALAFAVERWVGGAVQRLLLPSVFFPAGAAEGRVLMYTAGVAVLAGVVSAVVPALVSARTRLASALQGGPRASRGRSRLGSALVVLQASASVILLVGAGLFLRSMHEVRGLEMGVDLDRVIQARIEWASGVPGSVQDALTAEAVERLEELPGVESAAGAAPFTFGVPLRGAVEVPGLEPALDVAPVVNQVTPGYFRTVGLGIVEGRGLEATDGPDDPPVAVVSRTMARALWPEGSGVGRCFLMRGASDGDCTTVVGVAEDASRGRIEDEDFMAFYLPIAQTGGYGAIYVRSRGDAIAFAERVSLFLRAFSPEVRYASAQTLREILDPQIRSWKLGAWLFSAFGLLALLVASLGLYSVLTFEVATRTRELGIRSALGAESRQLLRGVLIDGTGVAGIGVVLGVLIAYLAAPRIDGLLFDVSARDPAVMVAAAVTLLAVAALASLVPAVRATRVHPATVLREE
jgi:predicted permease